MSLHANCDGCARQVVGECLAFTSPHAMWADGARCWGYTDDAERVEGELADCLEYAQRHGANTAPARRALQRYQTYHCIGAGRRHSA